MAQSLPEGWWQQDSAENILEKAKSITHGLSYFQGSKAHLLNNRDASIEFSQRLIPDGTIETKYVYYEGSTTVTEYKIKSGRYLLEMGRLVKAEFEDHQKELSLAATLDHPYDYKILQPEIVGNNDCLVIARIATPEFQNMLKAALYPSYIPRPGPLGDPTNYIISEIDTYILKSNGVVIGEVKKNKSGEVREDILYDVVKINNPIPDAEFVLPKAPVETATNMHQLSRIMFSAMHADNSPSPQKIKWMRSMIIGIMIISMGVFLYIIFKFRRTGTTD